MVRETRHLWVGNLPENIREDRIYDHFKRYGKVQSVKILAKNCKSDDNPNCTLTASSQNSGLNGVSATVAFIDLKSAAKAHNSENKLDERSLKTDYYEPPASSTALSAIYIHEREDAHLVQKPGVNASVYGVNPSANARPGRHTPSNRLSDDRLYDRDGRTGSLNNYDRIVDTRDTPYIKRYIGSLDDSDYPNRSRSRDRPFSRNLNNNNSYDGIDNRNQSHFRAYNRNSSQTHFDGQRYPSSEQLLEEPNVNSNTSTTNSSAQRGGARRVPSVTTTSGGVSSTVSSPPLKKKKKKKSLRSHSASPSPSRSSSLSSTRSQSPSSSSNISTSSASSRSASPAKSQSPLSLYSSRKERSGSSSILISAATTTNNISTSSQGSNHTPLHNSAATPGSDSSADKDDSRPVAICVKNLPVRSTDSSLKDGLFHEYKKHGKVTMVKVVGQGTDRFAVVCFKKPEDVDKALVESKDKLFFGCKIEVSAHEGIDAEDNDFRPLEAELDEHHPKATRTLFVGNLEKDVSTSDLKTHFEQFGEIIEIDIKKQGNMTSYAFIQFSDISSVVKAMRKLDGENLGQNRIKLGFGKSMPTNCVWIHGVAEAVTEKTLLWHANRFGTVVNLVLDRERSNALIIYDNVECAQIAVQDLKGRVLSGRKMQVDFASRECQTAFFDYLEMSGQIAQGEKSWEQQRRTANSVNNWTEFEERIPTYDSHNNSNRGQSRYQSRTGRNYRPQSPLPFPRNSQTNYVGGRGRAYQRFPSSDIYSEDFVERRHRNYDLEDYDDNEDGFRDEERDYRNDRRELSETCSKSFSPIRSESPKERREARSISPYSKSDINNSRDKSDVELTTHSKDRCNSRRLSEDLIHEEWKASDGLDRRRSKHKSCESDIVICHSPPVVRRLSHSKSPLPKEKAPSLMNSKGQNTPQSPTSSPCSSGFASPMRVDCADIDVDKEFDPSCGSSNVWRRKSAEESQLEMTDALRLRSDSVSDSSDNGFGRESLKRKRVDNDSPDTPTSSEAIGHLERKKRLLACVDLHKERTGSNSSQSTNSSKTSDQQRVGHELESLVASETMKSELAKLLKRRSSSSSGANSDIKYLESKSKGSVISLMEHIISHHNLVESMGTDTKTRSKHNINSSTKTSKCSYSAKDTGAVQSLRIVDATLPLVNHSWPDPRRQLTALSSLTSLSTSCSAQLCSTHTTNCKQIHRKLERSDAIYEISCDSDVNVLSRVSSSDIECTDRTLLKQDLVHTTTPKLEDHCSSEVSSSSDKKSPVGRLGTCPLSLPLPEFAITTRAGASTKVTNIPVIQPSHLSPKSTTIMSPLGQMSPNSVVPKNKLRENKLQVLSAESKLQEVSMQCLVTTTDNPDSNTISDIKQITTNSTKATVNTETPFEDLSDAEDGPNRSPSIEDRIRALDAKYNAWSGTTSAAPLAKVEKTPTPTIDYSKYHIKKKSQTNANSSTDSQTSEPSDIVKNLLSKSSIFDQDSKRLELINEKYEPKDVSAYESLTSPVTKPVFRTKAAAKEFSTPTTLQLSSSSSLSTAPTDKLHPNDSLPKSSSLHHSSHTPSHHSNTHPIPGSMARKLSEPTRMPSGVKKEPSTPTTPLTPVPHSAPARSNSNPFSLPFGRSSSSSSSSSVTTPSATVTRPPNSNLLSNLNMKKDLSIMANSAVVGAKEVPKQNRDPRENRDPRVVAKKDNTIHNSIITNTSAMNMQSIKDQTNTSTLKKELSLPPKSEFQKKASQLQQHSSSLPPHLASSGFSAKAENRAFSTTTLHPRPDLLNKKSEQQVLSVNKKHSTSDTTDANDSNKSDKIIRHHSQSGSVSKDNADTNVQKRLQEKSEKKSEINKSLEKNRNSISGIKLKDEKKSLKNLDNKQMSKNENKDKEKSKSKSDVKSDKKSENNPNKESKSSSKSEKSENKQKKDKNQSKDKSKETKLKASEIRMLLSIPDTDEPKYFSMYDKVKARSSANQNLKVAKDMECVRQKFSQLKDKRQHKDDRNRTSQDTDSDDSDDSLGERLMKRQKKAHKKRKIIFDASSDSSSDEGEVIPGQQHKHKPKKLSMLSRDSSSDSDVMISKSSQKPMKKLLKDIGYTTDSSEDFSTICSPKTKSAKPPKLKLKSSDDSSDDEMPQKLRKKKEFSKKKVKKDKDKSKSDHNLVSKEPKESKESQKETKVVKTESKADVKTQPQNQSSDKVKKIKLLKDKDNNIKEKDIKKRKESSGTDNEESKQQKLAKRKKKKSKISKLGKEKRHSSANRERSEDKPSKHSESSSSKAENMTSDHDMRSSGMSDLEEVLKRAYPEIKSDESDSETRTHVIKCYNKDAIKGHNKDHMRGVFSHTEWEKSETMKSNEKTIKDKVGNKSGAQLVSKTEKPIEKGNKSPKKAVKESVKESVVSKDIEISPKKKSDSKPPKDDKSTKEELKRKKLKKQMKNKDKDKDRERKEKDKEVKEKTHEKSKDKESKKNKNKEDVLKTKCPSTPPKTPDLMKSSLSPTFNDLIVNRDNDSSSSDSKVDEDLLKNARMLEECMLAAEASNDSNSSNDDLIMPSANHMPKPTQISITNLIKPTKDEQKIQQRRYEEEAAIQSLRLQKELMEERNERTDHLIKDMKRPFEEFSTEVTALKAKTDVSNIKNKPSIDESIFSDSTKDVFAAEVESALEKIDESKECDLDDQRAIEDDLAVAALLQDMNDPIIKDSEEYKVESEEYVSAPTVQMDEISYMGMLGDEEPPLQIAESPIPDTTSNDETSAALKSISDELNDKNLPQIRDKSDMNEESMTKGVDSVLKTETIVQTIVAEIKKESTNEWQSTPAVTTSAAVNPCKSIGEEIKAIEVLIKSSEIKNDENIDLLSVKSEPIVKEITKEDKKQTKELENKTIAIDKTIDKHINSSNDSLKRDKSEQKVEEKSDNVDLSVSRLLSPSPLLPSLTDDRRDTCSDSGVSDRTEIFDEEVDSVSQIESESKPKQSSFVANTDNKTLFVSSIDSKSVSNDENRDESETDDKKSCERPRRGRRAKTRKYSESSLQLPRYETGCVSTSASTPLSTSTVPGTVTAVAPLVSPTTTPLKRGPKPLTERIRRSGRTSGVESAADDHQNDELSGDEQHLKIDEQPTEEEPKKVNKRGRKKKVSGTFVAQEVNKTDESQKKERILLSLPVPSEKNASDIRKTNSPFDIFEFRDSDEEDGPSMPFESIHNKSTELSKAQPMTHSVTETFESNNNKKHVIEETQVIKAVDSHHSHPPHPHQPHPHPPHPDQTSKEYVSEVSQHGKLSITIRLHSKDGQDGGAAGTAEVVKTSKALLSDEDNKQSPPNKAAVDAMSDANKGLRKSARLMSQVPKTTIDETIEDVIKGSHKEDSKSKRMTRSARKSEESIDLDDDQNDDSKNVLRSYRITRSSTRGSITGDTDSNDNSNSQPLTQPESQETANVQRRATLPQLPVLKVELPKMGITTKTGDQIIQRKRSEDAIESTVETKGATNEGTVEGEESRASPSVLLDPVTGLLEPVQKKAFEHTAVIQAIKPHASLVTNRTTISTTGGVCQTPVVNTVVTNPTIATSVITTPSVITSASITSIQDIPTISERIHGSTGAVKLKTGKPFNLPEIEKPVVITSAETTPTSTIVPITPTTPAAVITPTAKTSCVVESVASISSVLSHPQPITITPKYPPPVGQPLVPIAQPMPSQWPQNLTTSSHQTSQSMPQTITSHSVRHFQSPTHSVVTTQHRPTIPSIPSYTDSKPKLPVDIINVTQAHPPPAHSKMTLEPKAPPSMPISVVTSHSSAEPLISPPIHSKHESRRDSISGKSSSKYTGLQIAGYPSPAHEASAHMTATPRGGVIEELLQTSHLLPQHQKELLANLQREQQREYSRERSMTPAAAILESAQMRSAQTPTPDLQNPHLQPHMAGLHLRPPSQPPMIVPHLGLHPNELQALEQMRQQMMYGYNQLSPYNQLSAELRARQEAQGLVRAAMNLPHRFVYPTGNFQMPLAPDSKVHELNIKERERLHERERSFREKAINKQKESGRESVGRLTQQEELELKSSLQRHAEAELKRQTEAEMKRQAESHERLLSSMQPPPPMAPLRIPFPSNIRQFQPHLSPHERYSESPAIVHGYGQGRPQSSHQLPPQMRAEELKQQEVMRRSPIVKMDDRKYNNPSDFSALHRQQLASPSPQYTLDSRSMQPPIHSPGSLSYRKETTRSPMPLPNDAEALRKQMMAQYPSKEMTSSPGPMALNMSQMSGPHMQLPHGLANEGLMRRSAAMHPIPQLGSEPPIYGPPPAHAISQPPHHQPQTPQHASQVPPHGDALLERYPVMWQGLFALKNDQAAVQMHYVAGNRRIALNSLPPFTEGGVSPLRIAQRMRLEQQQLQGLARKIQTYDEHCILLALPCGRDHMDVLQQSNNLKTGFITYLQSKQAAGIVNVNAPGSQQPAYVVHIFPNCEFSHENLVRIAPDLLHSLQEISHLLVVIATV